MRCGSVLIVLALALIAFGYQEIMDGGKFHKPVVYSFDEIKKCLPEEGVYTIEGAEFHIEEAVYSTVELQLGSTSTEDTHDGPIVDVFLPLHKEYKKGAVPDAYLEKKEGRTNLVLRTTDKKIIQIVEQLKANGHKSSAEIDKWMEKNADKLRVSKKLTGKIREHSSFLTSDSEAISKLEDLVASDYMIMEDGFIPTVGGGFQKLGAGIVIGILALLVLVGRYLGVKKQPVVQV
ncbi:MAG: hypothetical protein ABJA67_17025 [Chthonomonadales bacterium]